MSALTELGIAVHLENVGGAGDSVENEKVEGVEKGIKADSEEKGVVVASRRER